MPYSHLKRWRVGSAIAVVIVWSGLALNIADGTVGWTDAFGAIFVPLTQWGAFWSPQSKLVRNAERRLLREEHKHP